MSYSANDFLVPITVGTQPQTANLSIFDINYRSLSGYIANVANMVLESNTGSGGSPFAYNQANAAYAQANAAYNYANTIPVVNVSFAYNQANAAYDAANTADTTAQNAYEQANAAYEAANTGGGSANLGDIVISNTTITTLSENLPISITVVKPVPENYWVSRYGDISSDQNDDYGEGVVSDSNNNIYIIGGDGNNGQISFLVKYSPSGNIVWQKTFALENFYKSGEALCVDSQDNIYAVISDRDSSYYTYLVKVDSDGNLIWQKEIQGGDSSSSPGSVIADSNNDVYLSLRIGGVCTIIKFNSDGDVLWKIQNASTSYVFGIGVDNLNNVYCGYPVAKYDASGNVIHEITIDSGAYSTSTIVDPDGNQYVLYNYNAIQKIGADGSSVWMSDLSFGGTSFYGLTYNQNTNSVLICGNTYSAYQSRYGALVIVSLDASTGQLNWSNSLDTPDYENVWYWWSKGFISSNENVFSVTGYSYYEGTNNSDVITLTAPLDGTGLSNSNAFVYYAVSGTSNVSVGQVTTNTSVTVTESDVVIIDSNLVISDNEYEDTKYNLVSGGPQNFNFNIDGGFVFPDNTVQTTAYTDNVANKINSAYNKANTAYSQANNAYSQANSAYNLASSIGSDPVFNTISANDVFGKTILDKTSLRFYGKVGLSDDIDANLSGTIQLSYSDVNLFSNTGRILLTSNNSNNSSLWIFGDSGIFTIPSRFEDGTVDVSNRGGSMWGRSSVPIENVEYAVIPRSVVISPDYEIFEYSLYSMLSIRETYSGGIYGYTSGHICLYEGSSYGGGIILGQDGNSQILVMGSNNSIRGSSNSQPHDIQIQTIESGNVIIRTGGNGFGYSGNTLTFTANGSLVFSDNTSQNTAYTASFENRTPSNSSDVGTKGDIVYDSSYVYICVASNTWIRAIIAGGW